MPWEKINQELLSRARVFELHKKRMRFPERDYESDFYIIESNDWVHVIPITKNNEVVFVEQFRQGIEAKSLECPGGIIDDGEAPGDAARRELEEETGYTGGEIVSLGKIHPNPAIQTNWCHLFAAVGVEPKGSQDLEPAEDIEVLVKPLAEVPKLIEGGRITHALCINTLYAYLFRSPL